MAPGVARRPDAVQRVRRPVPAEKSIAHLTAVRRAYRNVCHSYVAWETATYAFRDNYAVVNIEELEAFKANAQVTPETLAEQGLITRNQSRGLLKILGNGDVDRVLTIRAHKVSAGARAKIEAAGGTIEIIPVKVYEQTKRRKDGRPAPTLTNQRLKRWLSWQRLQVFVSSL